MPRQVWHSHARPHDMDPRTSQPLHGGWSCPESLAPGAHGSLLERLPPLAPRSSQHSSAPERMGGLSAAPSLAVCAAMPPVAVVAAPSAPDSRRRTAPSRSPGTRSSDPLPPIQCSPCRAPAQRPPAPAERLLEPLHASASPAVFGPSGFTTYFTISYSFVGISGIILRFSLV